MTMTKAEAGRLGGLRNRGRRKGSSPEICARRATVMRLMTQGHGMTAIARQTGLRVDTVRNDLNAIRRANRKENTHAAE